MEGVLVQNQPSSGKITRHNSQLLDNENDDIGMMQDSLETRRHSTGTHSSEESRLIDRSPDRYYDEDLRSEGSIETEKQYQEDLKERVKRSFAELGLNPDVIQGNKERSISPQDSLEIPVDLNEHTVEKDNGIFRGSVKKDFDEQNDIKEVVVTPLLLKSKRNSRQSGSGSQQNFNNESSNQVLYQESENLGEQKQFANHNQNNSAGIVDEENHDDDHPSTLTNDSVMPLNDDLQLRTISGNNFQDSKESDVGIKKDSHASGSINSSPQPVNSRKGSAGKTYRDSSLNSPMRKPPSGKPLEFQSPENKFLNPKRSSVADHALVQDASVMKEEGSSKDLIQTLSVGETVRVEYISDDSGDDDEHYVDEKGSPIHFDEEKEEAHRQEYRIKPRPPATPIDSLKQPSKLRRYSLERHKIPSREEPIIDASNAGILSIEKVPNADPASWNELKDTEETLIADNDAGTGHINGLIPNLMKHENNRYASASSKEHVETESKFVDANIYAKIQHRAQQKIKSREASAGRQLKKEYVRPHQPSRYHSSRTSTGTKEKERIGRNGSTNSGSKGTSIEIPNAVQQHSPSNDKVRSKNIPLSIDKSRNIHENDEENNNRIKAHLIHETERTGKKENLQSVDHDSHHQPLYPNQNDHFGGQTSHILPSAPPFAEPGYQQDLKSQLDYQEDGNDKQHALLYGRSNQSSQYHVHPIQPAYQPVPVQQQHFLYTQGAASHQGQQGQQHAQHYQNSAPYQAPPQHNQGSSTSQFGNQMEPMHYHNENHIYQSNHQNRIPLQHYNQHEAPYHNFNPVKQHTYQARIDNQIPIQRPANVNYPGNQLNFDLDQNQHWQVRQRGQAFHLHNQDTYAAGPYDALAVSNTQTQQFYQDNPDSMYQQEQPQQHQFQSQLVSQPHIQPAHQSWQGSSHSQPPPLYGMQSNQQTLIPHYQMQENQQQQLNEAYEEIPPLDLSGLVEDHSQSTHHMSKQTNPTRKTNVDKSKINFIEQNKAKLRGELPQTSYLSRYKKDINPRKPLPGISRENSEERNEKWPQIELENNYEGTWITDPGVDRRRFMELPRQQSDTG
ncbi:probable serine/threonine-protein kinase yakA, partial [Anneissia japonica]|uniref:probable serine/threonine-protein kinase yakA n=1 Tax=Anneissia japonica TaxID=1529436 RepID=UPI0014256F95